MKDGGGNDGFPPAATSYGKVESPKRAFPLSHSTRLHISDCFKKGGLAAELRSPSRLIVRLENATTLTHNIGR
jgi:hypothetical protein